MSMENFPRKGRGVTRKRGRVSKATVLNLQAKNSWELKELCTQTRMGNAGNLASPAQYVTLGRTHSHMHNYACCVSDVENFLKIGAWPQPRLYSSVHGEEP